jgi:hypothetical protein
MIDTNDTSLITQTDQPETVKSETEVPETPEAFEPETKTETEMLTDLLRSTNEDHEAEIAIAVGLAVLRSNLNRDENYANDYTRALLESDYGMARIEKVAASYELHDNATRELVRAILRADGRVIDDDTDVDATPQFAAAKKYLTSLYEFDDYYDLLPLAGDLFAAGRLSKEAETGFEHSLFHT